MKNIAIFSLAYAPFFGGAEVAVKEITHRLRDGFKFICFTYKFDKAWRQEEELDGIKIVRVGQGKDNKQGYYGGHFYKIVYIFLSFLAARKQHQKEPFTQIWAIMAAYAGGAALLFKLFYPQVPLLLTLQEGDSEEHILGRLGIFYPFWKMLFKKADHIQVISTYLEDFARRHGAKCPITVVPNGADLENIKNQISKIKDENNKSKIKKNKRSVTIITTSRLVRKNGIDTLVEAAKELKNNNLYFKVLIAGGGPEDRSLRALAKKLAVDDVVEFLGEVLPVEVPLYLAHANIFVRASRSEGLGNSFIEAMAAGLPIIGTNVGGIPDFLKDPSLVGITHATGLFARVGDGKDLAHKILFLINKPELAEIIVKNARDLVFKNYSWDKIALKMGELFV